MKRAAAIAVFVLALVVFLSWMAGGCKHASRASLKPAPEPAVIPDSETTEIPQLPVRNPPVTGELPEKIEEEARSGLIALPADHPLRKKWPQEIQSAVISPDRTTVAFFDGSNVYLTNPQGRRVRKLPITLLENLANEQLTVSFAFRKDSRRIAILTSLVYGEPMGAFIERLWTADTATGRTRKLSEWADRVQGPGPIVAERALEGWTSDGKSVVITGVIYDGLEMPSDAREVGTKRIIVKDVFCSQ